MLRTLWKRYTTTKPVDITQFMQVIQALERCWLQIVVLPPKTE